MRMTLDAVAGRASMNKDYDKVYVLIEDMKQSHYHWGNEYAPIEKALKKISNI